MNLRSKNCWLKTNHQKNLQLLGTEIFNSKTGVPLELMNDIFHFVERSDYTLERKWDHTVYNGLESLSSLAPKLQYADICCPCRICKKHFGGVRFI